MQLRRTLPRNHLKGSAFGLAALSGGIECCRCFPEGLRFAGQGHLPLPDDHKPVSATATEELVTTSATFTAYVSLALPGNTTCSI